MKHPNGYGSIFKLSGRRRKPWAVRLTVGWTDEGKQQYEYLGYYAKRQEAIAALAEYNNDPYDLDARKMTFSEVYAHWFKERFNEDSNANTVYSYESAYKNSENLHGLTFVDIKSNHLQDVVNHSGLKESSNNNLKKLYNQMYKFAMKNDLVKKNYAEFVSIPKNNEPSKRKPFTKEEIEVLWKHKEKQVAEIALLMIYTGMRPGEILTIKKENINLDDRYLIGGIKTAAGIDRTIPLNKKIIPFIEKRLEGSSKHMYLNGKGNVLTYTSFKKQWDIFMEKINISHNPHNCRHTCRTLLNNANANSVSVDRIMGHASESIGDRVYTHKDVNQLLLAIDLI